MIFKTPQAVVDCLNDGEAISVTQDCLGTRLEVSIVNTFGRSVEKYISLVEIEQAADPESLFATYVNEALHELRTGITP